MLQLHLQLCRKTFLYFLRVTISLRELVQRIIQRKCVRKQKENCTESRARYAMTTLGRVLLHHLSNFQKIFRVNIHMKLCVNITNVKSV